MISRGYEVEVFEQGNHDVYEKEPVYNFEMHTSLYGAGHHNEWISYYDRIKDRLRPKGNRSEYRFTDEDFYVYIMTHMFKHFDGSGTGIRSLLDQYVYLIGWKIPLIFLILTSSVRSLVLQILKKKIGIFARKCSE